MSLFGLSPAAFAIGALAIAAGIALLHLLRVRLRRVEVDTLLFFELAGTIRQPRVLLSKPARWLAFLLALAAAILAWTALGDPRTGAEHASRVVLVEPAPGELFELRLREAERWTRTGGLGPRGAVLVASAASEMLLGADEPIDWLRVRESSLSFSSDAHAHAAALQLAAAHLGAADEIVWIGSTPPAVSLGVPLRVVRIDGTRALRWDALRWECLPLGEERLAHFELVLEGDASTSLSFALLDSRENTVANAAAESGPFALRLRVEAPRPEESFELRCLRDWQVLSTWSVPSPAQAPHRIGLDPALEPDLAKALRAVLALDARFEASSDIAGADVIAAPWDEPSDPRPRLVLAAGEGAGPRAAEMGADAPVRLSLRDRERRAAPALAGSRGTTWIEDLRQGAQLARADLGSAPARIEIVDWLLEPITHADVPVLLLGALELLAGGHTVELAPASRELALIAGDAAPFRGARTFALPAEGRVSFASARSAGAELAAPRGTMRVAAFEDPAPLASATADAIAGMDIDARGGSGSLVALLLVAALALFALDAWGYHRGRLP